MSTLQTWKACFVRLHEKSMYKDDKESVTSFKLFSKINIVSKKEQKALLFFPIFLLFLVSLSLLLLSLKWGSFQNQEPRHMVPTWSISAFLELLVFKDYPKKLATGGTLLSMRICRWKQPL